MIPICMHRHVSILYNKKCIIEASYIYMYRQWEFGIIMCVRRSMYVPTYVPTYIQTYVLTQCIQCVSTYVCKYVYVVLFTSVLWRSHNTVQCVTLFRVCRYVCLYVCTYVGTYSVRGTVYVVGIIACVVTYVCMYVGTYVGTYMYLRCHLFYKHCYIEWG